MKKFNEIAQTVDRREMGMGRAVFLMIATLLLWCGTMLLVLDLAASAAHGGPALIGLVLVAIGGSCLWADFLKSPLGSSVNVRQLPMSRTSYMRLSYPRFFTREAHLRIRRTANPRMPTKGISAFS